MEDIPLVIKVILSTASIDRVNIFDLLIAHKGVLNTTIIEESLNMSPPTAAKTMTELKAIDLVEMSKVGKNHELQIKLKKGFEWFLDEEFAKLREGFVPVSNTEFMKDEDSRSKSSLKEKSPPSAPENPGITPPVMKTCEICGEVGEAFYMRIHNCRTGG